MFVGELERSMEFYTKVCGLSEVFREPPIKAGFLSNGSSHHDVALIEISARARKAGDGSSLISEKRGMRPGTEPLRVGDGERTRVAGGL